MTNREFREFLRQTGLNPNAVFTSTGKLTQSFSAHRLRFRHDVTVWQGGERFPKRHELPNNNHRGLIARMYDVGYRQTADMFGVTLGEFVRATGVKPKTLARIMPLFTALGLALTEETAKPSEPKVLAVS